MGHNSLAYGRLNQHSAFSFLGYPHAFLSATGTVERLYRIQPVKTPRWPIRVFKRDPGSAMSTGIPFGAASGIWFCEYTVVFRIRANSSTCSMLCSLANSDFESVSINLCYFYSVTVHFNIIDWKYKLRKNIQVWR